MQMGKNLEAHHIQIEGLQRELAKALDTVDDLEKDQTADRAQLLKRKHPPLSASSQSCDSATMNSK